MIAQFYQFTQDWTLPGKMDELNFVLIIVKKIVLKKIKE